jgi:hypothetical protein
MGTNAVSDDALPSRLAPATGQVFCETPRFKRVPQKIWRPRSGRSRAHAGSCSARGRSGEGSGQHWGHDKSSSPVSEPDPLAARASDCHSGVTRGTAGSMVGPKSGGSIQVSKSGSKSATVVSGPGWLAGTFIYAIGERPYFSKSRFSASFTSSYWSLSSSSAI